LLRLLAPSHKHHHHGPKCSHHKPQRTWTLNKLTSVTQLTKESVLRILALADKIRETPQKYDNVLHGYVSTNLFFEPSTRTACSFNAAMQRLGGRVIDVTGSSSSAVKGESLHDTIRTLESYSDLIVMRHPSKGAATEAADSGAKAFVNAGDGTGEHPTQALLDIYTIIREIPATTQAVNVCMVGDLKHGRTVHSLAQLLVRCLNVHITYVAPKGLEMPTEIWQIVEAAGGHQSVEEDLNVAVAAADVVYVTRLQKERFASEEEYNKLKDSYSFTRSTLALMKPQAILLHPLPRVNEISPEVDADPRAAYFRQMENGMYVRMAILSLFLLGHEPVPHHNHDC